MKKSLIFAAMAMMAVAVTACGGSKQETTAAPAETTAAAAEAASEETTEETEEETTEAETAAAAESTADDSDLAYVQEKGTLVVGITDFEPMDYKDASGNWIGFDADMAAKFAESLGVDVEFVEIDWDNKILELDGKTIDCVWNGMTLTDEVISAMECSKAY